MTRFQAFVGTPRPQLDSPPLERYLFLGDARGTAMRWLSLLAGLAVLAIAVVGVGALVGLVGQLGSPAVLLTVALLLLLLAVGVLVATQSRPRGRTPYWG